MLNNFDRSSNAFSRGPLGIIALFLSFVYATSVAFRAFSQNVTELQSLFIILFIVIFPILVLLSFVYLVAKHPHSLYPPSEFKDEENFLLLQSKANTALVKASAKPDINQNTEQLPTDEPLDKFLKKARGKKILWIDDNPKNNSWEVEAFESIGLIVDQVRSTDEAINKIQVQRYDCLISDMSRPEGNQAGYDLLKKIRNKGLSTPFIIYASDSNPDYLQSTIEKGGNGNTNNPFSLYYMVIAAVGSGR